MEDFWKRAKSFAEETAKKSQTLTTSSKIADLVAETAKKSKELALEASKKADEIKTAALKQADQIPIKSITDIIPPQLSSSFSSMVTSSSASSDPAFPDSELRKFGVTDDLRDFVKGLTSSTFQNFPLQGSGHSNCKFKFTIYIFWILRYSIVCCRIRWSWNLRCADHGVQCTEGSDGVARATCHPCSHHCQGTFPGLSCCCCLREVQVLVLNFMMMMMLQGISKLRYELCPRVMKERKFWKIYFTLVSTHVAP